MAVVREIWFVGVFSEVVRNALGPAKITTRNIEGQAVVTKEEDVGGFRHVEVRLAGREGDMIFTAALKVGSDSHREYIDEGILRVSGSEEADQSG